MFRLGAVSIATLLTFGIGLSRMYLGVHYPSDVLAGYLVGVMWVAFCVLGSETAQRLLRRSRGGRPPPAAAEEVLAPVNTGA